MKHIVVTGFEPFGGETKNASQEILPLLHAPEGWTLHRLVLPVAFATCFDAVEEALKLAPEVILCLGQASDRQAISLERVALNWVDARIPDNLGMQPQEVPILHEAPAAYFSGLPLRQLEARCRESKIPVELSSSAGLFVCNALYFRLMHAVSETRGRAGFIHVPALPEPNQARGQMPLADSAKAIQLVVDELCS